MMVLIQVDTNMMPSSCKRGGLNGQGVRLSTHIGAKTGKRGGHVHYRCAGHVKDRHY
jgi:hypothetical protein